ncbi:MAG TPA: hypothetical protein VJT31_07990 [Rugosimonospora sp.]|nr:hypothetical protein [Rugosimonospora sp.]
MGPTTYGEFKDLVRASKRAWHVEFRDTYNVESEDEPFRRFLAGEHDSYDWLGEWLQFISKVTASGVAVQRMRLVSIPHCDYTRWGLTVAPHNIEAGEEIRYLPRTRTADLVPPAEDYWLLDDDTLVLSVFSDDGRQGGFARETDPQLVAQCRDTRDQLWPRAIPYDEYVRTY